MNYIGDHPLNLIGKVAIVTSAASPTGAAICRELLNSNANVLGVDNIPAHKTTSFSKGSHFQFFQYDNDSVLQGEELIEYAKKVYLRDNVDFLIDVLGETNVGSVFLKSIMNLMQEHRGGMVLSVLPTSLQERSKEIEVKVLATVKNRLSQVGGTALRCNVMVAHDLQTRAPVNEGFDKLTRLKMKDHIAAHVQRRGQGGYEVETERDIANLTLFLCTKQGERVSGLVIGTDGEVAAL